MADIYTAAKRSEIMSRVRSSGTRPEVQVRSALHGLGLRFRLVPAQSLPGKPDLVFRRLKTVVFVNGCFWHGHNCAKGRSKAKTNASFWARKIANNIERDRRALAELRDLGWRAVTVWECQTRNLLSLRNLLADKLVRG